jgi:hypothetical protein
MVLHVIWNGASVDAQIVERILSSVHGTALLLFPFPYLISVSNEGSVSNFSELTKVTAMQLLLASVAFNRVRTTIFSQLFGVNGSAIPDDMQNHFEY